MIVCNIVLDKLQINMVLVISFANFLISDRLVYIGNDVFWSSDRSDWFVTLWGIIVVITLGVLFTSDEVFFGGYRNMILSFAQAILIYAPFREPNRGSQRWTCVYIIHVNMSTIMNMLHKLSLVICYRLEKGQDFMPWNLPSRLPSKAITSRWYQQNPS